MTAADGFLLANAIDASGFWLIMAVLAASVW
jgi:hypothetical protein